MLVHYLYKSLFKPDRKLVKGIGMVYKLMIF